MTATDWIVVIAATGLVSYVWWKARRYRSVARLRRQPTRRAAAGEAGICLWGYNDRGELTHVRVKREAASPQEVRFDDIPDYLRGPRTRHG